MQISLLCNFENVIFSCVYTGDFGLKLWTLRYVRARPQHVYMLVKYMDSHLL